MGQNAQEENVVKWLYDTLSILDAKANGLLTVNAFFMTVLVAVVGASRVQNISLVVSDLYVEVSLHSLGLLLVSSFCCFMVIRVSWKMLGKVTKGGDGKHHFGNEETQLANAVDDRTHFYWLAWSLSLLALAWVTIALIFPSIPRTIGLA